MGQLHVVVGGQAGSESKGRVTADIIHRYSAGYRTHVVRVAGPNAGHTVYGDDGRRWPLQQIPVAAVVSPSAQLYIGPGSEIDLHTLQREVTELEDAGYSVRDRLYIDPQATILEPKHGQTEGGLEPGGMHERIGSTGKGVGAARAERIMRRARIWGDLKQTYYWATDKGVTTTDVGAILQRAAESSNTTVVVEGTQGYDLGLHRGYYPYCTSSDCRVIDFLAMAGIPAPWVPGVFLFPWVVLRTYPIRVAGNSGPMFQELTWEELAKRHGDHIKPEMTTVTKKIRRVGEFDLESARRAVADNGGPFTCQVALSFVDYPYPADRGKTDWDDLSIECRRYVTQLAVDLDARISLVGTGPRTAVWVP